VNDGDALDANHVAKLFCRCAVASQNVAKDGLIDAMCLAPLLALTVSDKPLDGLNDLFFRHVSS